MKAVRLTVKQSFVGRRSPEAMAEAFRQLTYIQQELPDERYEYARTEENAQVSNADAQGQYLTSATGAYSGGKTGSSRTEYKPTILLAIITDADSLESKGWALRVRLYRDLLQKTYGEGNVYTAGATLGSGIQEWLTQEAFFEAIDDEYDNVRGIKEAKGELFFGFDQVHIIGHGVEADGPLFKYDTPFKEPEEGKTTTGLLHIHEKGKIVIATCHGNKGPMENWMRDNLPKWRYRYIGSNQYEREKLSEKELENEKDERVCAVKGYIGIPKKGNAPKGWEWHPSLRQIADFLGIPLNQKDVDKSKAAGY